ncbi:MAG: Dipeptidyl-peptidase 5 [Dehalococcoidia bacterium]|nr:Dipeptidyl-peptidase 5 [Bacillota bacterium]
MQNKYVIPVAVLLVALVVAVAVFFGLRAPDEEPMPPGFEAVNLEVSPAEVGPGEPVNISIKVRNVGEERGTHNVVLRVDGEVEATKPITLAGGEEEVVSFTVKRNEPRLYTVRLAHLSETFRVEAPPEVVRPPHELARAGDFSIALADVEREEEVTTLHFALTKVADTDAGPQSVEVTLIDTHDTEYHGTLSIDLAYGYGADFVVNAVPEGFTYVAPVQIPMPRIAPIVRFRLGDEEIRFADVKFAEAPIERNYDLAMVKVGESVPLGRFLTFHFGSPAAGSIIGWTLPTTVASTEYSPIDITIRVALRDSEGKIRWFEEAAQSVPGKDQAKLAPTVLTIGQVVDGVEPLLAVIIAGEGRDDGRFLKLMTLSPEQLPPLPERIAFQRPDRHGACDIWVMNADGSEQRELAEGEYPVWSPDGTKIAFQRGRGIWVMNADGSEQRWLAEGWRPAWSPDGTRIAFEWGRGMWPEDIWVMNADGSEQRWLAEGGRPAWSPDGTKIAFQRGRGIWVMNADGSEKRELAEGHNPVWSPDGSKIAFVWRGEGQGNIRVMNADGSEKRVLAEVWLDPANPAWSPDGSKIVFEPLRWVYIGVVNADGSEQRELAEGYNPVWSPDGTKIVFVVTGDWGEKNIWVMNADGSEQRELAEGRNPAWASAFKPGIAPTPAE